MVNFTFKKQPRETGLASIANPYPCTDVKLDGKLVGIIRPPHFRADDRRWSVGIMVKRVPTPDDPCEFRWATMTGKFDTESEARLWLKVNQELIKDKFDLHLMEPFS